MFKPAKIEYLPKMNFRYRLLKVENEWYLMEVDRPIITRCCNILLTMIGWKAFKQSTLGIFPRVLCFFLLPF